MLLLLLVLASPAKAETLSLTDCVGLALKASPDARTAASRLEISRRHLYKSYAAFGPEFGFQATQALAGYDNAGNKLRRLRYDEDTHEYTLSGNWTLFKNFNDVRAAKRARLDRDAARESLENSRQGVVAAVWRAYFGELLARRLLETQRGFLESQRAQVDLTDRLYKGGVRSQTDLLAAQIQARQSDLSVLHAELAERSARAALNVLIDREPGAPVELKEPPPARHEPAAYDADVKTALAMRPDARIARLALDKSRLSVRDAWWELFPALSLDASYRYRFDEPRYEIAPGVSVAAQNPYWQVGARLDFPVFDGGRRWQDVKIAKFEADVSRDEWEALERRVRTEIFEAHLELERNERSYELSREVTRTAEENVRLVLEQYRQGNMSSLTVKDAQNSLLSLQQSEAAALYNSHIARASLKQAMGALTPEVSP